MTAPARPAPLRAGLFALVVIGGAVGTLARYELSVQLPSDPGRWPWGTFLANVVGSFALGLLLESLDRRDAGAGTRTRAMLGTGFCGGFTTYSTFAVEIDLLAREHHHGLAAAYLVASLVAGLVAVVAGIATAAALARSHR